MCRGRFRAFVPHSAARPAARCPRCGLLERHRGLFLFLERRTELLSRSHSLLHVAPEPELQHRLRGQPRLDYVSLDLASPYAEVRGDLHALPFATEHFDAVICSHVLEHVEDDRRALAEIARVLAPDGCALLLVPVDGDRATTYEDPEIVDPEARRRAFGQDDHVRSYGVDFPARVRAAGLEVEADRWLTGLPPATVRRYGLGDDTIYRARRSFNRPVR